METTLTPDFFAEDGSPLTAQQRANLRRRVQAKNLQIDAMLKAQEPTERNHWKAVIAESEALGHRVPDRWRIQAEKMNQKLAAEDEALARRKALDGNPNVQKCRAVAAEWTGRIKSVEDEDDVAMLTALADRPDMHGEFWSLAGNLADRHFAESSERVLEIKRRADESTRDYQQAEMERSQIQEKVGEAKQQLTGGNDNA